MEFDAPALGCKWSPDLSHLVLATEEEIILVSNEFHILAKEALRPLKDGTGGY